MNTFHLVSKLVTVVRGAHSTQRNVQYGVNARSPKAAEDHFEKALKDPKVMARSLKSGKIVTNQGPI